MKNTVRAILKISFFIAAGIGLNCTGDILRLAWRCQPFHAVFLASLLILGCIGWTGISLYTYSREKEDKQRGYVTITFNGNNGFLDYMKEHGLSEAEYSSFVEDAVLHELRHRQNH